jgi:hypothetical protein
MIAIHKLALCLRDGGPGTPQEMSERSGISINHCRELLRQLVRDGYADVREIRRVKHARHTTNVPVYRYAHNGLPPSAREVHFEHPADRDQLETDMQARAWRVAMRGQRYDGVEEGTDVRRFDLARVDAPSWSSLA